MTRFLVDAQLPPALARWLTAHGHPSQHVFDFGGEGPTDDEVLLVLDEAEFDKYREWCSTPVYWAAREGKVLYESATRPG